MQPKKLKSSCARDLPVSLFTVAQFTIAKTRSQPAAYQKIKVTIMWQIDMVEYPSAVKQNGIV